MSLDEALLREDCAISESKLQLLWEFPLIMTADGDDIAANMTEVYTPPPF